MPSRLVLALSAVLAASGCATAPVPAPAPPPPQGAAAIAPFERGAGTHPVERTFRPTPVGPPVR